MASNMMANNMAGYGLRNGYYGIRAVGDQIRITGQHIPRGNMYQVMPGWSNAISRETCITNINNTGNAFIHEGVFTPESRDPRDPNLRGHILGSVTTFTPEGELQGTPLAVDLGRYIYWNRFAHITNTLEIRPSDKADKLTVVERVPVTKGLPQDRAAYIYNITRAGTNAIKDSVIDLSWIRNVRVTPHGVAIDFLPDGFSDMQSSFFPGHFFIDNLGKPLLQNRLAGMSREDNFFQSSIYTPWTSEYRPAIDSFDSVGDGLKLVLHRTKQYDITAPEELRGLSPNDPVRIFPSLATSAVQADGSKWVPLTLKRPLEHTETIDTQLSGVFDGEIQTAIGPQTRLGNRGEISSYARDPYFYGDGVFTSFGLQRLWGSSFGLNRAKALDDKFMGIQSGRTHTQHWSNMFNPLLADLLETNNPNYIKLSNFGAALWGPGVSEDTQMDKFARILGLKMWVVKDQIALMTAEKVWDRYKVQNTERYNRSEQLFVLPAHLAMADTLQSFLGARPSDFMNWGAIFDTMAGRTWYKVPFAKLAEKASIPLYLSTFGQVLCYPVDLPLFLTAWAIRTTLSSTNYAMQLRNLGFGSGVREGFIKNPVVEDSFLGGYLKDAFRQHLEQSQFGTFVATVSGGADKKTVPALNRRIITGYSLATAASLGLTASSLFWAGWSQTGLPHIIDDPVGIGLMANFMFGVYSGYITTKAAWYMHQLEKKNAQQLSWDQFAGAGEHSRIVTEFASEGTSLTYPELFALRGRTRSCLVEMKALNRKGQPDFGFSNPFRDIANQAMITSTDIEMAIFLKAAEELRQNRASNEARDAIRQLAQTSTEFTIIKAAGGLFRDLGLELK